MAEERKRKRRGATRIGDVPIPRTRSAGEDLAFEGRVLLREAGKRGGTTQPATRRIRLRQAREGVQRVLAGTIAANRAAAARRPATPEEKRNGNITPSTTPQATNGNGVTPGSFLERSRKEIEKRGQ